VLYIDSLLNDYPVCILFANIERCFDVTVFRAFPLLTRDFVGAFCNDLINGLFDVGASACKLDNLSNVIYRQDFD